MCFFCGAPARKQPPHPMTRLKESPLKKTVCGEFKLGDLVYHNYYKGEELYTIYRISKSFVMCTSRNGKRAWQVGAVTAGKQKVSSIRHATPEERALYEAGDV